jgi:glycosyltransferase involved in cell wall biosynthesis
MEAMACGVPCVGFQVGGIPEMIDHKQNGYVAQFQQADDLSNGIRYVLAEADYEALSRHCLQKVARCWSQQSVANKYMEVYEQALRSALNPNS